MCQSKMRITPLPFRLKDVYKRQAIECGHYENLSLDEAKKECRAYLKVLESQTNMEFTYPQ